MAKFAAGQIVGTPGALDAIADAAQTATYFLGRHLSGDWGEVPAEDAASNEAALRYGERLISAYRTRKDVRIWIITEHDRSVTTILLPEEY